MMELLILTGIVSNFTKMEVMPDVYIDGLGRYDRMAIDDRREELLKEFLKPYEVNKTEKSE